MNQVTSTLNRFDIRCVESLYEPENTNVLWITRDDYGRINSIQQFWNGEWETTATDPKFFDKAKEELNKINGAARVIKVTGTISTSTISCKDADFIPTSAVNCRYATKTANGEFTWSNGKVKYDSAETGTTEYYIAFLPSSVEIPRDKIINFAETL